jgi:hypothetical protein
MLVSLVLIMSSMMTTTAAAGGDQCCYASANQTWRWSTTKTVCGQAGDESLVNGYQQVDGSTGNYCLLHL